MTLNQIEPRNVADYQRSDVTWVWMIIAKQKFGGKGPLHLHNPIALVIYPGQDGVSSGKEHALLHIGRVDLTR